MDISANELVDIGKAEQVILNEWREYERNLEIQNVAPGAVRCTFVLEPMVADFLDMRMNSRMIETVRMLVKNNIWFSEIKRVRLELDKELWDNELESKNAFGQLFKGLFNNTRRSRELAIPKHHFVVDRHNLKADPLQLDQVQLFCPSTMPASDFVAFASAMTFNQTVKKLELRLVAQSHAQITTRHWWRWLAYALFSKRARAFSALETLAIVKQFSMTRADMEAFTKVLASEHPEETLFDSPRGVLDERIATLKSGAEIRWQFNYRGELLAGFEALTFPSPTAFVQTFSDDGVSEWVNVLIAGYGRCQVQRGYLEFHEPLPIEESARLSTLQLEFINDMNSIRDGLPLFLRAIGHSLNSLTLIGCNLDIEFNTTLRSCPNLLELSLRGDVIDLQFDFSFYREICQPVTELSLDWNNVSALARGLRDDNNPLFQCIQRLRVRPGLTVARGPFDPIAFEADVDLLLEMLAENQFLKYFMIIVPYRYSGYTAKFRKFNLQPTRHTLKLPLVSKLAFISAVSAPVDKVPQWNSLKFELGQDVLCKIFEYATSPVFRQVFCSSEHTYLG